MRTESATRRHYGRPIWRAARYRTGMHAKFGPLHFDTTKLVSMVSSAHSQPAATLHQQIGNDMPSAAMRISRRRTPRGTASDGRAGHWLLRWFLRRALEHHLLG